MPRPDGVMILVPGFPGSESETDCLPPVQNFVKVLAQRNPGISIDVVAFQYPFTAGTYSWHGATVHAIAGGSKHFPWRLGSWVRASWHVYQVMRKRKVVVLHSMWLAECTYVAAWISRLSGAKHVASIRGQDALDQNPYLKHLPFDKMIITAGSEHAASAFERSTGRKVNRVLPSGLDAESTQTQDEPGERTIDILGVGSLSPIKDFASFIDIVAKLRRIHPGIRSVILGDGPEHQPLMNSIRQLGLEGTIDLEGHVPREQVLRTMRKARILLHTSRFEGQGYVFLEALGSGMQVVCRNVGYAGDGAAVHRCGSNEEILAVLDRLLTTPWRSAQPDVLNMDWTVREFERLYFED
jgi:glycosyltransferase involved in cell wall biosynthesis